MALALLREDTQRIGLTALLRPLDILKAGPMTSQHLSLPRGEQLWPIDSSGSGHSATGGVAALEAASRSLAKVEVRGRSVRVLDEKDMIENCS